MGLLNQSEIQILKGLANIYLLRNPSCALLVDTGHKRNAPRVASFLKENNVGFGDLKLIIITHSHYDHVGSLAEVKEQSGAEVLVHQKEAGFLRKGITTFPKGTNIVSKIATGFSNAFSNKACSYRPVEPEITISVDIDLSEYGINASILCTPGHTDGSISVIVDNDKAVVGDTVFNFLSTIVYPPWADDIDKLHSSWKKLLDTECKVFYPAHGLPVPVDTLRKKYERRLRG
jgi:hydroxyacylglutathione hydrolase